MGKRRGSSGATATTPATAPAAGSAASAASDRAAALALRHLKRTRDAFGADAVLPRVPADADAQRLRIAVKLADDFGAVRDLAESAAAPRQETAVAAPPPLLSAPPPASAEASRGGAARRDRPSEVSLAIQAVGERGAGGASAGPKAPDEAPKPVFKGEGSAAAVEAQLTTRKHAPSATLARRMANKWPRPEWRAPWRLYRVAAGHIGWVKSVAVEPGNEWFVTGSGDRTIKVWDLASGQLKLTLTGHTEAVTGLCVSPRHPYMFSCGLDKTVKCWDLEYNKVIRSYHGHLSGVYSIAMHPGLDILFTGGRDASCRVWDMRTRTQIFCLSGHDSTVCSILSQKPEPQLVTGSHDSTIKLWDLSAGKCRSTLTYHKKAVRSMCMHPSEFTFAAASADNIKKYQFPDGDFLHNMLSNQRAIVNTMSLNEDGVVASGGDDGSLWFWDWKSGHCFQQAETIVQPGSLEAEAGIFASAFDQSGTRLITCEADKSVKMWREVEDATPETHPNLPFKPPAPGSAKRF